MVSQRPNDNRPPPDLDRRDSWELDYSDDEDDNRHQLPSQHQRTTAAGAGAPRGAEQSPSFDYDATPSPLRTSRQPSPSAPQHTHNDAFGAATAAEAKPRSYEDKLGDIPDALRPGGNRKETNPFLRKMNTGGASNPPTESFAKLTVQNTGTNPFQPALQAQSTGVTTPAVPPVPLNTAVNPWVPASVEQSPQQYHSPYTPIGNPWESSPPVPAQTPAMPPLGPPPVPLPVSPSVSPDPWAASSPDVPKLPQQPPLVPTPTGPWSETKSNAPTPPPLPPQHPIQQPPASQPLPIPSPGLVSAPSDDEPHWTDEPASRNGKEPQPPVVPQTPQELPDTSVWDNLGVLDTDKGKNKATDESSTTGTGNQMDDWSLVDVEPAPGSSRPAVVEVTPPQPQEHDRPPLPPRTSNENLRFTAPRTPVDSKAETYQVKNIKWYDANVAQNPRTSPILVQNANGPCPLVALVNALSLTTPPDVTDTAMVEILRSREQISLNLLLDAVLEELMSPRRTNEDASLPDITELYSFLQSLHTGMNVNPRFVPTPDMVAAFERTSLTHLEPGKRSSLIPGTFENTAEMNLYRAFNIPLVHGWLPPTLDPAYEALERQAASYEDAQNLLFREEELDQKLSGDEGLTLHEQQLYQDIMTIKNFLLTSATQLTAWGIDVISKAIRPGAFAILFRNDHFSTLYCHPGTSQLVTLVTDDGYRSHEGVVWESLVDVNGERTQYLSGDFKVVTSNAQAGPSSTSDFSNEHGGDWTTVQGRRERPQQQDDQIPVSPLEQEDRDLALALQLQEEEDQRHREDQARRQHERNLSEQVMEPHDRTPASSLRPARRLSRDTDSNSIAPARRSSNTLSIPVTSAQAPPQPPRPSPSQQIRPMVPPRRDQQARGDAPPPPYEQAAQVPAYEPPPGHPSHPGSRPDAPSSQQSPSTPGGPRRGARPGQRPLGQTLPHRPFVPTNASGRDRERDCLVM